MRQRLRWRVGIVAIAAAIGAAAWWVTPLFGSEEATQQIVCEEVVGAPFAPDEPLEMNSVLASPLFKTIAMEKEVFVCRDGGPTGPITQIHDLETFIEIVEKPNKNGSVLVNKRVETALCTKDFLQDTVRCNAQPMPLVSGPPSLQNCVPHQERPRNFRDPIVMNTVNSKTNVKTIKVEKEVLDCPGQGAVADLYIFTEISEAAVMSGGTVVDIRPVKKAFEGIKCLKELDTPKLRICHSFTPDPAAIPVQPPCTEAVPPVAPEEPLEMNSVLAGPFFKTIAMEKEVFVCGTAGGGPIRQIHDLETFIEIVERPSPSGATVVSKRVETALCTKDFAQSRVSCTVQSVPLLQTPPSLEGCGPHQQRPNPRDPVEMNTVNQKTNVKTIKVEKEILFCPTLNAIAELYLFTEIHEAAVTNAQGKVVDIAPVAKTFEGIKCLKDVDFPRVRECHSFTPLPG